VIGDLKNKNAPPLLVNLSLIGYVSILVSSAGYYGYYRPNDDALLIPWILWALVGGCCLGYKNFKAYRATGTKLYLLDIPFILAVWLLPNIPLQKGLSIIATLFLGAIFTLVLVNMMFHPWKKETSNTK
jgi:hypothetical protein